MPPNDLVACRTAALGGHVLACPECGHQQIADNSCGNRHCPTCQATASARWLEARAAELLPVPYFHLVFTLPNALNPIALANPRVVYDLLLRCAAETVLAVAANPDHLGARTGVLAVLHTWGQALQLHPHVHCVAPGGGLSFDRTRWVGSRPDFFLPVRVLSRVFRGKLLAGLRAACVGGRLRLSGRCGAEMAAEFEGLVSAAVRTDWVVYAQRPFGGPEVVLKYLARYTHRVAISDSRILDFEEGEVSFRYKDYAHGNRKRVMRLSAREFVRRLLLHVLPAGLVRIRHYGLLSNRHRQEDLALCREWLGGNPGTEPEPPETVKDAAAAITPTRVCPHCGAGRMIVIAEFGPSAGSEIGEEIEECAAVDSS